MGLAVARDCYRLGVTWSEVVSTRVSWQVSHQGKTPHTWPHTWQGWGSAAPSPTRGCQWHKNHCLGLYWGRNPCPGPATPTSAFLGGGGSGTQTQRTRAKTVWWPQPGSGMLGTAPPREKLILSPLARVLGNSPSGQVRVPCETWPSEMPQAQAPEESTLGMGAATLPGVAPSAPQGTAGPQHPPWGASGTNPLM